jgi:hypothetical protein
MRYRLSASAMFRWGGPEDEHYQGEGVTRDLSVAGAYVLTATCPPPNALIQVEVFLPLSGSGPKAFMKADMMVVRVEHEVAGQNRSGFSAVSKGFSLSTTSERASRIVSDLIEKSESSVEEMG